MAMKYELIKAPSESAKAMIMRRMPRNADNNKMEHANWGAALLVQGLVVEIMAAADIGSKAADVAVSELLGSCPQHVTSLAFVGTPSQINQVLYALKNAGKV